MKRITLTEKDLHKVVKEAVQRYLNEAESYGWVVEDSEVEEAYNLALESGVPEEELNKDIVGCISTEEKAKCLAFLFRNWDFREWPEYQERKRQNSIEEPIVGENKAAEYWLNNSPHTRFARDNHGQYAMDVMADMDDGGIRHGSFSTPHEAWGEKGIQQGFVDNQNKKKEQSASKRSDKRWKAAADKRPLHRKGSLNRG